MNIDALLREALTPEHLDLPVRAGFLSDVRMRRRRRRIAGTGVAAGAIAVTALAGISLLQLSSPSSTLSTYASGGVPAGTPVPGISPEFIPQSGRDWLLTSADLAAFNAGHAVPRAYLFGDPRSVPSPAPVTADTDELRSYAAGAALPPGCTFTTDEAYDGDGRVSVLHITLPDGKPVWLQRQRLAKPHDVSPGEDINQVVAVSVEDIPATTSALATYDDYHFGFGEHWNATGTAHAVNVATVGGVEWTWIAPHPVPVPTLKAWAISAEQRRSEGS